jgi:hypothetical protein
MNKIETSRSFEDAGDYKDGLKNDDRIKQSLRTTASRKPQTHSPTPSKQALGGIARGRELWTFFSPFMAHRFLTFFP